MKFRINTKAFSDAVIPAADIALKNTLKDFPNAKTVTIKASSSVLQIIAHGGTASITVKVAKADGYDFEEKGELTVHVKELQSTLNAFSSSRNISVTVEDNYLKISPESNNDVYISVPASKELIVIPRRSNEFEQQVTVDREYFIKGLEKIKFAPAFEEKMYSYMCVLFESGANMLRFSSGTGGRFAVVEYNDDKRAISTGKASMIFPDTNIANIISILKKASCSTIKVTLCDKDDTKLIPDQVVLEVDNIVVCIYGLEYFTNYPDFNKIIQYNYPYRISTYIKDWMYIADAIAASKHFYEEKIHNMKAIVDLLHGRFDLATNGNVKMNLIIDFALGVFEKDSAKDKNYKPWFACNSDYLREMVKFADKRRVVIFNFLDQSILDEIPDDKPKQMKPILLKYPEIKDKDGVREKLYMFFTVSTKW